MENKMSEQHEVASNTEPAKTAHPKRRCGFASLSTEQRIVVSRLGGLAATQSGRAHQFTSEEARLAGQKGGRAPHAKRRARTEAPLEGRRRADGHHPKMILTRSGGQFDYAAIVATCAFNSNSIGLT
jgi:hypothetical protein